MQRLTVLKVGGNVIDSEPALKRFLDDVAVLARSRRIVLVHGGGKLATDLSAQLGLPTTMMNGRRVTDAETLRVVTMVYAGFINKNIVVGLQARQCNALGLTGADANILHAHKRPLLDGVDYGFVGDVDATDAAMLGSLLAIGLTPVFAPLTHDGTGTMLNTNADTVASALASAMAGEYEVELLYCFEKAGVLRDVHDETSVIPELNAHEYQALRTAGAIAKGMIPKLDNAFAALQAGVRTVLICHADSLHEALLTRSKGTRLV
jgi:acetylglutamate kinase